MQAHFSDIQAEILRQIHRAKYSIKIAVAWLTDSTILNALAAKAKAGVAVELILSNVSLKDFNLDPVVLKAAGGEVFTSGAADFREGSIMHNKFAIIDYQTVITGSFNWTNQARRNEENIVVINDELHAGIFAEKFEAIKANSSLVSDHSESDEISLSFTTSKNVVDPGQTFEIHWEANNAEVVKIDNGIGVVENRGSKDVTVLSDTYFNIEARQGEVAVKKSLFIRIIEAPTQSFTLTYIDPTSGQSTILLPSRPLLDSYSAIAGMNLTLSWQVSNAESVRIDNREVNTESGSMSFVCDGNQSITIEVFGIKHYVRKSISINAIPLPTLDRLTSPFPSDIQVYTQFDFYKVQTPSNFKISGNPLSFLVPRIRELKSLLVRPGFKVQKKSSKKRFEWLAPRGKVKKKNLQTHLLTRFKGDEANFSFLEKILKRYE